MKPVSKTAYYTARVRMPYSKRQRLICGDTLAHVFMSQQGIEVHKKLNILLPQELLPCNTTKL